MTTERTLENHVALPVADESAIPQLPSEVYYLESILRQLREYRDFIGSCEVLAPSIGSEVLADNTDWLDCHIETVKKRPIVHRATIDLCLDAVRNCASLDENGYICEKQIAMNAIKRLVEERTYGRGT